MDLKRKKIIAKEVLILSGVISILFVVYCGLLFLENNRKIKLQDLSSEKVKIVLKIDSIKLKISNQTADSYSDKNPFDVELPPLPPKDFTHLNEKVPSARPPLKLVGVEEYKKWLSNTTETLDSLNTSLKLNKKSIKGISYFDKDEMITKLILIILLIVYPFRGLILLVKWSIKTVKE